MEPRGILTMMTDFLEKRLPPSPPRKRKRDTPTPETSNDESSSSESERATKRQRQNDSEGSDDRRSKDAQTPNLQSQRGTKPNLKNRAGNVKPSDSIDEPLKKSSSSSPNITPPPTGLFTRILSPFGLSPRPQKLPKVRRLSEFMEKEEVQELLPRPQTERKPRREVRFNPSTKGGGASNSSLKKVLQRREKHLKYIAPSAAHKNIDNAALSIQANTVGGYRPPHCESVTDEADKILAWESKGDAPFPSLRHPHPSISCPPPLYPSSPSLSHLPPPPPTTGYISNLFSGITGNAPPRASANAANSADKPSISRTVEGSQLTTADLPEGPVPVPLVENSRDTALSTEPRRNEDVNPRHNKFEDNDHTDDDDPSLSEPLSGSPSPDEDEEAHYYDDIISPVGSGNSSHPDPRAQQMRYYENNLPNWLTGPSRTRRLHSAKARLNILGNNQEVAPSEPSGRGEQDGALSAVEWYNLNDPRSNISFKKGGARPPEVPVFKPAQTLKEHIHEMMDGGISLLLFPAGRSYAYWAGEDDAPEYILEHDRCDRVNEVLGYGWARVEKATKSNSNHITGMKPGHENEREYEKDHDGQRQDQAEREVSRDESDEEGESEITSEEKGGDEGAGEGDDEGSDDEEEYEGDSEDCEEDEGEWEEDDGEEEERVDYREDEEEEEESDEDA